MAGVWLSGYSLDSAGGESRLSYQHQRSISLALCRLAGALKALLEKWKLTTVRWDTEFGSTGRRLSHFGHGGVVRFATGLLHDFCCLETCNQTSEGRPALLLFSEAALFDDLPSAHPAKLNKLALVPRAEAFS